MKSPHAAGALRACTTLLVALGAALPSAGQEPLPPVVVGDHQAMDPEIAALIAEHVAKVEAAPANGDAHADLGLVYEANTLFDAAIRCYENALILLPDQKQWAYRKALMQHASGDFDGALESMRVAAEAFQRTPVIQARYGYMLYQAGRTDEAAAAWEQALAAEAGQPQVIEWPESRVGLAQVRVDQGRTDEAVELLEEALALDPDYRHAHYLLGQCYLELGKAEEAEVELARGVNAWPRFPADPHQPRLNELSVGFHRRMMDIENMLASGDTESAFPALQAVLQEHPEDHFALNLLAKAYSMTGQLDEAVDTLRKSEEAEPDAYATKIELSIALMNQLNERQTKLQAAPPEDPEEAAAAQAALNAIYEEILAKARAAAQLAPTLGRTRFYHGLALFMRVNPQQPDRQQLQAAVNEMSIALTLGCQEPALFEYLARGYQMMGQPAQMLEFARANARSRPDQLGSYIFLAQACVSADDQEGALAAAARAVELAPGNPQVAEFEKNVRAEIARRRGQTPGAGAATDPDRTDR